MQTIHASWPGHGQAASPFPAPGSFCQMGVVVVSTPWGCPETQGDDVSKCTTMIWIHGGRAGPTDVVGVWQMMKLVSLFMDLLTAAGRLRQVQMWPQAHGERAWRELGLALWPWHLPGPGRSGVHTSTEHTGFRYIQVNEQS